MVFDTIKLQSNTASPCWAGVCRHLASTMALRPLNINAEVPTPFILPFTWYKQQRLYWQLPKLVNVTISADGVRDPSRYSGLAHDDRQFGLRITLNQTTALDRYQGYHLVSLAKVNEAELHYVLARCACPCAGSLLGRPNSSSTSSGGTSHGAATGVPVGHQGGGAQPQGLGRAKETEHLVGSSNGGSDSGSRGGVSALAGGVASGLSSDSRDSTSTDGGEPAPHAQPLTHNPLKLGYCRCPCHTWQEHWPAPSEWCGAGHGQRKGKAQPLARQRAWDGMEPGSGGEDGEAASDEDRRGLGGAGGEGGVRKRGRPPSGRGQAAAGQRPAQRQRLAGPPQQPRERAGQDGRGAPLADGRHRAGHGVAAPGGAAAAAPAALRRSGSLRRGKPAVDDLSGGAARSGGAVGPGPGAPARSAGRDGAAVAPGAEPGQPSRKFRLMRTPQTGRVIGSRLEVPQSLLGVDVDLRQGAAVELQLACDGEVWPEPHRCELQVEGEGGVALLEVPPGAVGRIFAGWGATFEGSLLLALEPLPRSPQRGPVQQRDPTTGRGPGGSRPVSAEAVVHGGGDVDGSTRAGVVGGERWQRGLSPAVALDPAYAEAAHQSRRAEIAAGRACDPEHDGGLQPDGDRAGALGALPVRLDAFPSEPAPRSGNGSDGSRPRSPGPGPSGPGRPAAAASGRPVPAAPAGGDTLIPSNVLHDYINYCGCLPQEMLLEVDGVLMSQVYGVSLLDPRTREHITLADMGRVPTGPGAVAVLRGVPPECAGLTVSGWGIVPQETTLVLRVSTAPKPQQEAGATAAGVRPAAGPRGQGELERQHPHQEQELPDPPASKRGAASEGRDAGGQASQQPPHVLDPVFARRAAAAGVHAPCPRLLPPRPPLRPAAAAPAPRTTSAPAPAQQETRLPPAQHALGEFRASPGPAQPPPANGAQTPCAEPIVVDLTASPSHEPPPDQLLPDDQPALGQPPPDHPPSQQPWAGRPPPDRPTLRQLTPELAPPPPATAPAPPLFPLAPAPAAPPPPLLVCFPGRPPAAPAWDITPLPPVEVPRPGTPLRATCVPLDPAVHARMGGLWGFHRMMVEVDGWVDVASSVRTVRVMQEPRTRATVIERLPAHAVGRVFVGWGVAPGGTVVLRTVSGPPAAHGGSRASSRSNSSGGTGSGSGARASGGGSQSAEGIVAARAAAEAGARVLREHEARRQRLLAAERQAQAAGGSGGGAGGGAPPVRRWSPAMDPPDKPARWAPVSIVVAYAPGVQVGLRPRLSGSGEEEDVSADGTVGGPRSRQLSSSGSGRASGAEGA